MSHLPANWQPPEPPKPPRSRNTVFPALITLGCALLLLGGSAFGALTTCGSFEGRPGAWFPFFSRATVFFFVVFIVAAIWFLVSLVLAFFRAGKDGL
jgi:hypothetical protein